MNENQKEWSDAITEFLNTPPGHPKERERFERAIGEDRKLREAGVFPQVKR
jgi:hypothetical protein